MAVTVKLKGGTREIPKCTAKPLELWPRPSHQLFRIKGPAKQHGNARVKLFACEGRRQEEKCRGKVGNTIELRGLALEFSYVS